MDVICDYFLILREIMSGKDNKKSWAKMLGISIEKEHDAWEYTPHGEVRVKRRNRRRSRHHTS